MFNNISEYIAYDALTAKVGVIVSKLDGSELPYVRYTQAFDRLPELFLELQEEAFGVYKNDDTYKKRVVVNYFHMINLRMIFSDDEERIILDKARQCVFPCYKKPVPVLIPQGSKNSSFVEKEHIQCVAQEVVYVNSAPILSCVDDEKNIQSVQDTYISERVGGVVELDGGFPRAHTDLSIDSKETESFVGVEDIKRKDEECLYNTYCEKASIYFMGDLPSAWVDSSIDFDKKSSLVSVDDIKWEEEECLYNTGCKKASICSRGSEDPLSCCGGENRDMVCYDGFLVIPSCDDTKISGDSESSVNSPFRKFRRKLSDIFGAFIQKGRLLGGGKNGVKKLPVPSYDNFHSSLKGRRDVALRKKNNIARNKAFDYFVDEDSDDPSLFEDNAHQFRKDDVGEDSGGEDVSFGEDHNFVKDQFGASHEGDDYIWYWTGSFDANFGEEDDDVLNWSYKSNPYSVCDVRSKKGNDIDGFLTRGRRNCVVEIQVDVYLVSNVDFPFKLLIWCSADNEPVGSLTNEDIQDIKASCDFREYDVEPHGTVDVEDFVAIRQIFVDSGANSRIGFISDDNVVDYYVHVALHGSYYWPEYVADIQSYVALIMGEG